MQTEIVLISDDSDFYEYIIQMLSVRKSDELYKFKFDEFPNKIHLLKSSLLIINSENNTEKTLELLDMLEDVPVIVFGYNNNEDFKIECYKRGMLAYFTPEISEDEFRANLQPALKLASSIQKNEQYRDILVNNNLLTKNNEVFLDCNNLLEREIEKVKNKSQKAVLVAVAPDDKTKFNIQANQIETVILNNIRKNDLLINFAPNKYFLLLYNTDVNKAKNMWSKINSKFAVPIYAGFSPVLNKNRQQLVNDVLNNLHNEINNGFDTSTSANAFSGGTFKFFRTEFNKKIKQLISPVFYHIQQVYNQKLFGMTIEQGIGDGYGVLYIKAKYKTGVFRITSPGFSTINIDISLEKNKTQSFDNENNVVIDSKRVTLEPEELEEGLLQDLIEQFITEFKREAENDNS